MLPLEQEGRRGETHWRQRPARSRLLPAAEGSEQREVEAAQLQSGVQELWQVLILGLEGHM